METKQRNKVYPLAMTAMLAAVLAVASPFTIPIGPIPISLCTLVIYLAVYVLGWKRGMSATLVYILLGAAGMPVFSNFGSGLGQILGPTGGYIIGYLPLTLIAGLLVERYPRGRGLQLLGLVLGTAVLYLIGTAWFCVVMDSTVAAALAACVFPFLPGDLVKMAVAMGVGPMLRNRLEKAGLFPGV